jgi:hypothetical protein
MRVVLFDWSHPPLPPPPPSQTLYTHRTRPPPPHPHRHELKNLQTCQPHSLPTRSPISRPPAIASAALPPSPSFPIRPPVPKAQCHTGPMPRPTVHAGPTRLLGYAPTPPVPLRKPPLPAPRPGAPSHSRCGWGGCRHGEHSTKPTSSPATLPTPHTKSSEPTTPAPTPATKKITPAVGRRGPPKPLSKDPRRGRMVRSAPASRQLRQHVGPRAAEADPPFQAARPRPPRQLRRRRRPRRRARRLCGPGPRPATPPATATAPSVVAASAGPASVVRRGGQSGEARKQVGPKHLVPPVVVVAAGLHARRVAARTAGTRCHASA